MSASFLFSFFSINHITTKIVICQNVKEIDFMLPIFKIFKSGRKEKNENNLDLFWKKYVCATTIKKQVKSTSDAENTSDFCDSIQH